jgi:hypothetical protein
MGRGNVNWVVGRLSITSEQSGELLIVQVRAIYGQTLTRCCAPNKVKFAAVAVLHQSLSTQPRLVVCVHVI